MLDATREIPNLSPHAWWRLQQLYDDGTSDTLTGSQGIDWFFANLDGGVLDKITDLDDDEFADVLDWVLAP